MASWNTPEVVAKLKAAIPSTFIVEIMPGQEGYSDDIYIIVNPELGEASESIHVSAFNDTDVLGINTSEDGEYEYCEVTDGLYSNGGLNSTNDNTVIGYIAAVRVMKEAGFEVVKSMRDYF